ncbi:MAG TPA: diphthine--ammonia ligase [Methanotrichaceae archaeon]|nr:diphthine--ammonia ligase [Methanotrichaceae archaeon]HQF15869.1 diphthine--ammonia ligase [Methanotrichaceae archaeon]HQI90455.1 diphthine--ammonia ligase [Methanotrichaceae archaeon]HQJ28156.1 diphthine--ammonia ligase [Methanotrichaceae archaeon]
MRLGVLFSGGKDSVFACYRAMQTDEVAVLITLVSGNEDSYMFHTPNISRAGLLAQAMRLPLLSWPTRGVEEEELADLRDALEEASRRWKLDGVVTGAIESVYQASRVQRICRDLDLWCFNPLWQVHQGDYLRLLLSAGFRVIVTGVFAYPLDRSWLGAEITEERIRLLEELQRRYRINPAGEGGELETLVIDGPTFYQSVEIRHASTTYHNYRGHYLIEEAALVDRPGTRNVDHAYQCDIDARPGGSA